MPNLHDIERRIGSVSSTKQITRTMEMVSSAKISRALARANQSEPYREAITDVMLTVAGDVRANGTSTPLLQDPTSYDRALVIAISSDRGLAGGFNMQVERAVEQRIKHFKRHGAKTVELIVCGRKVCEHFRSYPDVVMRFEGASDNPTIEQARSIANYLLDGYAQGTLGRVDIVYFHAKNRVEQQLRAERIVPLDPEVIRTARGPRRAAPKRLTSPFEFSPSAEHVLQRLIPSYALTVVHQALIDSAAAEHGARRKAMHSATENATEIIDSLNRTYNRVRQASITTEINEIVGGAAALEEY